MNTFDKSQADNPANNLPSKLGTAEHADDFSEELKASVSALVDGELSRSESAFLLKRMEHDAPLRALWLRYQDAGDCLRGQNEVLRQNDFSSSVMAKLNSGAFADADDADFSANSPAPTFPSAANKAEPATPRRFVRAVRYVAAAAMAATVAAVTLSLPSFNTQPAAPTIGFVSESAGARAAQTLPITVTSPGVSAQPVSSRLSTGSGILLGQSNTAPLAIDEFLLEHNQGFGGRSAIAPMVYSVSEADIGYLVPSTWESAGSAQ
jgi:negative regulator of sigma E activity